MKTLLVLGVVAFILVAATNTAWAQPAGRNPDSNPTQATVNQLRTTWQKTNEKAVRKQIELTLENMGAPVAEPLATLMEYEFWRAAKEDNQKRKDIHLDTVIVAAKILGKQGNAIARDDYVTEILMAFTHDTKQVAGMAEPEPVIQKVRVAAIDALGRIFAQKAVFLVLQSPNSLTREKNKEALTAVEYLRNETQDLKQKITSLLVAMKKDEVQGAEENGTKLKGKQKGKDADEAAKARKDAKTHKEDEAVQARDLLLATRNLCRKFKSYQKLQFIMSELEPPIGKDKDLSTRITEALSGIEANLLDVWAPPPTGKDTSAPGKNENKGISAAVVLGLAVASKDQGKSENKGMAAVIHAGAMAEQKANELSDEMDDLVQRVDEWLQLNDRTRKVILTFQNAIHIDNGTIVNICAAEALGRVYLNRD